jgi:Cof subfamily protein (haloacid dehalogenase superfamily)
MNYQLIALDVDGTTVNTGQAPSPRVRQALDRAQAQGLKVIVATGRAFQSAREYARMLGLDGPLICLQGALVKEQVNGEQTLLAEPLPPEPLGDLIRFADERELELTLYTEDEIYVSRMYHERKYYDLWFSLPVRVVPSLTEAVAGLKQRRVPLIKALFIGDPQDLPRLEADLNRFCQGRMDVVRSHEHFVELLAPGVSKGRALAFLAQRYGVSQGQTIAVGDSGNDISMIRWAGLGVAVANAAPEVRAAADWIAPSVNEDGVAVLLERYVLERRNPA